MAVTLRFTELSSRLVLVAACLFATAPHDALAQQAPTALDDPNNPDLSAAARQTFDYLRSVYGKKTLAGYNVYVHTPDVFEQTGRHGALWSRDITFLKDVHNLAEEARNKRYILSLHWHWPFAGQKAWKNRRKDVPDIGRMLTPGTRENVQMMRELSETADKLAILQTAGIPVLWRPLHEIDGGWFWWTDTEKPQNTANLWRFMYDYFTHERKLNNLIWVYSAGEGRRTVEQRRLYYPGSDYVDIAGIDIYHVDYRNETERYWEYFNAMMQVAPGKMLACCECDAIPNPDKTASGELPPWLYALPWYGTPTPERPIDWAKRTMAHSHIVTLSELPTIGTGPVAPRVSIRDLSDDGSAATIEAPDFLDVTVSDPNDDIEWVILMINQRPVARRDAPPYRFVWPKSASVGLMRVTAVARDRTGLQTESNAVRMRVGLVDVARNKPVQTSSGEHADRAVDGDHYTGWSAASSQVEWIIVDLGKPQPVGHVNLMWGFKIHAVDYSIGVASADPGSPESWTTVSTRHNRPYQTWKATDQIVFPVTTARFVRVLMTRAPRGQDWGGYRLNSLEVLARPFDE